MKSNDINFEDPKLLAPCGTNCGVCPYLIAYKTKDDNLKQRLANSIGIKPEQIICEGCMSDDPFFFCKTCPMKDCVLQKESIDNCSDCEDYPCKIINKFPFKIFLKRQTWDVGYRRDHSREEWINKTIEMNTCPSCGELAHWRARVCKACGNELINRYG